MMRAHLFCIKKLKLYYYVEIIHYMRVYIENGLYFLIDTRNFRFLKAITAKKTAQNT